MAPTLNEVYPWGRSLEEYQRMFSLGQSELESKITGCADGPASFNAEMFARGRRVISCDPLYAFSAGEIRQRIDATYPQLLDSARRNHDAYVWESIPSVEELGRRRMSAMTRFLEDYEAGRVAGRYVVASLPHLPFADGTFDLALCSHFLFLYSAQFPLAFHVESLLEMTRVARQVRVFPLLDLAGRPSPHVEGVIAALQRHGLTTRVEPVAYEFQRGGNRMLRIRRPHAG